MRVTTTTANGGTTVNMKTATADTSVRVNPGETPAQALQRMAADSRAKAARLIALADRCEAGADVLLTPAA